MSDKVRAQPSSGYGSQGDPDAGLRWMEFGSTAVALGVLVQAALAGQILTGRHWLVASHRVLAEVLPILAVGLVVLASKQRSLDRSRSWLVWALAVAVVVMVAQTGLGFVGRTSPAAIAIHVPLGVALLGVYVLVANATRGMRATPRRAVQALGFEGTS